MNTPDLEEADQLRRAVRELTSPHNATHRDTTGRLRVTAQAPLLVQLRAHITEQRNGRGGRRAAGTGSNVPLALDALDLLEHIRDTTEQTVTALCAAGPHLDRTALTTTALTPRLTWAAHAALTLDRPDLCRPFIGWPGTIRNTLDPPRLVPLPGHTCPMCHTTTTHMQVPTEDPSAPAEFTEEPALCIRMGTTVPAGMCRECGAEWAGRELLDLTALLGGDRASTSTLLAHLMP